MFHPLPEDPHVIRVREVIVVQERVPERVPAREDDPSSTLWPEHHREHPEDVFVVDAGERLVIELLS